MQEIRLNRSSWHCDLSKPLAPAGGFGQVFEGRDENDDVVAIKRLKIDADASSWRELKVSDLISEREFQYIIPVYDAGCDANTGTYFVVMAKASYSLQDKLDSGQIISITESIDVLAQIAKGLMEASELVHRDIKPANILFHGNRWKIADFGIARFTEETTSLNTLKGALSPQYAAPEQWKLERSSHATDVYALGCVAFALLTGGPPFPGPDFESFKQQHITETPRRVDVDPPLMQSLVSMMLRKQPETRPKINRILELLESAKKNLGS